MPAIYQGFEFEPNDTIEQKQSKLYMGITSCEEMAYTLNAAIQECRKQLTLIDSRVTTMRQMFKELKGEVHASISGSR